MHVRQIRGSVMAEIHPQQWGTIVAPIPFLPRPLVPIHFIKGDEFAKSQNKKDPNTHLPPSLMLFWAVEATSDVEDEDEALLATPWTALAALLPTRGQQRTAKGWPNIVLVLPFVNSKRERNSLSLLVFFWCEFPGAPCDWMTTKQKQEKEKILGPGQTHTPACKGGIICYLLCESLCESFMNFHIATKIWLSVPPPHRQRVYFSQ